MNELAAIVISNIFVATLIGCLAWLVGRSGHRAQLAHVLWVAFFVKLVTPPLITLPIDIPAEWVPAIAATAQRPAADSNSATERSIPKAHMDEHPQLTTGEIPQTATSAKANDAERSLNSTPDGSRLLSGASVFCGSYPGEQFALSNFFAF